MREFTPCSGSSGCLVAWGGLQPQIDPNCTYVLHFRRRPGKPPSPRHYVHEGYIPPPSVPPVHNCMSAAVVVAIVIMVVDVVA